MTIRSDPEGNEVRELLDMVDLTGRNVLEIGSGDGRLTWLYAEFAASVTAVEPFGDSVVRARKSMPDALRDRVELNQLSFEAFSSSRVDAVFDIAILSWSL